MKKLEAKITTELKKWILHNHWGQSFPFEVKVSRAKSFNFKSNIKPHQIRALRIAKHDVLVYKLSDMDRLQKPFDGFVFVQSEAYFVIFWDKRGYFIDVDDIDSMIKEGVKSITEEQAKSISEHNCLLK